VRSDARREAARIVFVSNTDVFFLTYRLPLALAERARGAEVVVAAPDGGLGGEIERAGFRFVPLPLSRRGVNPWAELQALRALVRLYREFRPHLVHHLTVKPVLYGSIAARLTGRIGMVNAVTGLGYVFTDAPGARLLRPLVKALYRMTQQHDSVRTIFENSDDRREFTTMGMTAGARSILIPGLGVNCDRFQALPEPVGEPVVVLPCRMLWDKGVGVFVEAAALLRGRGIPGRFVLVGEPDPGNPRSIPVEQLRSWADEGAVEWWGRQDDMPRVFAEANLVVLPTYYREGVPRVLLEAASSGRALVATDMPGCREVVRDGVNGLLVPPRDAAGLSDALAVLLCDAELRAEYGRAGRAIVEAEFSERSVIDRMLDLHQELLDEAAGRGAAVSALSR
jgi:glycosyltransferase involved in cell wall biosynthesis